MIGPPLAFADGALACPLCGGQYLHQGAVEVYHRSSEDAESVVHAIVGGTASDVTDVPGVGARNPSQRRQGLLLHFDCETCDLLQTNIVMAIWQHQGSTFIEWRLPSINRRGDP